LEKILEPEVQNSDSLRRNSNTKAKSELLSQLDDEQNREKNISFSSLIWTYIVVFFALLFLLPKIYISNQIYYISKDINKKYHKYTALREENRYLKKKIEQLQYQNQIIDDIELP